MKVAPIVVRVAEKVEQHFVVIAAQAHDVRIGDWSARPAARSRPPNPGRGRHSRRRWMMRWSRDRPRREVLGDLAVHVGEQIVAAVHVADRIEAHLRPASSLRRAASAALPRSRSSASCYQAKARRRRSAGSSDARPRHREFHRHAARLRSGGRSPKPASQIDAPPGASRRRRSRTSHAGYDGLVVLGGGAERRRRRRPSLPAGASPRSPGRSARPTSRCSASASAPSSSPAATARRTFSAGRSSSAGRRCARPRPARRDPLIAALGGGRPALPLAHRHVHPAGRRRPSRRPATMTGIQAFRIGRAVYGIQFHFEADRKLVETLEPRLRRR